MAHAQEMTLSQQIIPEVVSKKECNDILEDRYGFLWFGGGGVQKYDGYSSKSYEVSKDSIPLGTVYALLEDQDGKIWIGSSSGLFQYDRTTDHISTPFLNQLKNKRGNNSRILSLFEDSNGWIWMGGDDNLFLLKNQGKVKLETITGLDIELANQFQTGVHCIREDHNGRIYAGTTTGLWEIKKDFSIALHQPEGFKDNIKNFRILDIEPGEKDTLWLAGVSGLWIFLSESHAFSKFETPNIQFESTRDIFFDEKKQLWVADSYKIYLRPSSGVFIEHPLLPLSITASTRVIKKDRYGNIWLGTFNDIVKFESRQDEMLPFFRVQNNKMADNDFYMRLMADSSGGLWLRMSKIGLGYCSSIGGEFKVLLQLPKNTFIEEIKNFCTDIDGNVWVITLSHGLFFFPKGKETFQHIPLKESISVSDPLSIIPDNQNSRLLWFSSNFGLCSIDRLTFEEKWYSPSKDIKGLSRDLIGEISQDEKGKIWFALTKEDKRYLSYFDPAKKQFATISKPDDNIVFGGVYQIKEVAPDTIWIGTRTGLVIANTKTETLSYLDSFNGLPTSDVKSIEPDGNGNIWFTSSTKLCKFDGENFDCILPNPGIEGFLNNSSEALKDGRLLFGGINGLLIFHPEKVKKDTTRPQLYLTNFEVSNKKRDLGKACELVKKIELPFTDNDLSFEFSGLHFLNQNRIQYRHKLERPQEQKDWVNAPAGEHKVGYTNLSPGTYTFRVIAANPDGIWIEEEEGLSIQLIINPPWYRTNLAYTLWILLFAGTLYGLYRFQLNRRLAEAEAHRLKELDLVKNRLYTNITHEFRTPLTIINGMADRLQSRVGQNVRKDLNMISRNGQQLLNLVNQMLDLAKLEAGSLPVNKVQGDIIPYLRYLTESFDSYAESKNISLHFLTELDTYVMDYDREKILNIVSNLLSNAIKFTPAAGNVYLLIAEATKNKTAYLKISVKDSGIGIASEELPYIFDRFYQGDTSTTRPGEGTGIGLALTRELVHLLKGSIDVSSKPGEGTTFEVLLPVSKKASAIAASDNFEELKSAVLAFAPQTTPGLKAEEIAPQTGGSTKPLLLIIEDNKDVIQYLTTCLEFSYQLVTAENGEIGIKKAIELVPDIIISDVMMPEKDGYEVCETLKLDERTSHIPIILLTAKADVESKIAGLKRGADAYLGKPFHQEELLVRLAMLIEMRKKLQARYRTLAPETAAEDLAQEIEDDYLQKVRAVIEKNMTGGELGVTAIAKELALSRSQFYRKINALTGHSAAQFILRVRLQHAKHLLETTNYKVGAVAYDTGFSDHSYFTRAFREEYGVSPSEVERE